MRGRHRTGKPRSTRRHFLAGPGRTLGFAGVLPGRASIARQHPIWEPALDLAVETVRVRWELATFRDRYLPALLAGRALVYSEGLARLVEVPRDPAVLRLWLEAADRLARAMPGSRSTGQEANLASGGFDEFLADPADGGYELRSGRIA
jgi:hypothetical protein